MQPIQPIDVSLTVEIVGDILAVKARFENISKQPTLVKEGLFGFGLRENKLTSPVSIVVNEYEIKNHGRILPYHGVRSYFISGPVRENFSFIPPGEIIATTYDRLDDSYTFLPGKHEYTIRHIHLQWDEKTGNISRHLSRPTVFTYTKK